jgi:hypothetical protein
MSTFLCAGQTRMCPSMDYVPFSRSSGLRRGSEGIIISSIGVEEILNLQSRNAKGKPYQVKQVRGVILKYYLHLGE